MFWYPSSRELLVMVFTPGKSFFLEQHFCLHRISMNYAARQLLKYKLKFESMAELVLFQINFKHDFTIHSLVIKENCSWHLL